MTRLGYDSLVLLISDFDVSGSHELTVKRSNLTGSKLEPEPEYPLFTVSGRNVRGVGAFHNSEHFNVSIRPDEKRQRVGCTVQFSAPKLLDGSNYAPSDERGLNGALNAIQGELNSIGVKTNIESGRVCRLDACKNIIPELPTVSYWPVMALLRGKRMAGRDYGSGFLWSNTRHQIAAYDKLEEMAAKKRNTAGLLDTLRVEHRLLKAPKVLDATGIRTAGDLRTGFDAVRGSYHKALSELFKAEMPERNVLTAADIRRELEYFKATAGRYWIQGWLAAHGVTRLLDMCSMDEVKVAVRDVTGNRKTANDIAKTLEAARLDAAKLQEITPHNRSLADLYGELRGKLLDE